MSLRILLADESSTIKKAFEIGLDSYGAEIKNVQHGIDVLEVAESFKPDIIFADVLISKMNGYEVCAQIKQNPKLQQTPVVLMWSGFMDIDEDKYFTCHADGKIEKPFSADQLLTLIQTLVQKPLQEANTKPAGLPPQLSSAQKSSASQIPKPPIQGLDVPPPLKKLTPSESLLFKEDIPSVSDDDFLSGFNSKPEAKTDDQSSEDLELDGFEALDLQDNSNSESSFSLDDPFSLNEDKEITKIPSLEEEQALFEKADADSLSRESKAFLDSELSTFQPEDDGLVDLGQHPVLDNSEDLDAFFGLTENNETLDLSDLTEEENKPTKTVHRNVEDLENQDLELNSQVSPKTKETRPSNFDEPINLFKSANNIPLTKEEIRQIVAEQAKEVIQSLVWEMIPELSKQMIEKEIKRLLAETDSL